MTISKVMRLLLSTNAMLVLLVQTSGLLHLVAAQTGINNSGV